MTTPPTKTCSRFISTLAGELDAFLEFRRALGHKYRREEYRLRSLDRFIGTGRKVRLEDVIPAWISRAGHRRPRTIRVEVQVARQFCLFLRRDRPDCFVPDYALAPYRSTTRFRAHIFTLDEIRRLVVGTELIYGRFRAQTFRTLLLLLFCTGMRFGEAVRLTLADLDLHRRTCFVRESKGRSRWVPFHRDLARVLRAYLGQRGAIAPLDPKGLLFVQSNGRGYRVEVASSVVRRLLRKTGLKPAQGRVGPRPYDLRHSFAVHRLTRWYRERVDLHAHLPWLSAYMGHRDLLGTESYLKATPELLHMASRRFARRFRCPVLA